VSQTGVLFQKGYEAKRNKHAGHEPAKQGTARQPPARQALVRQAPARQALAQEGPEVQTSGSKRKQPDNFEEEVERPQYGSSFRNGLERRQVAGPKRVRQDIPDDREPSSFMGNLWSARPAVGSRLRPVELPEADVRESWPRFQSDRESAGPLSGPWLTAGGMFEGDVPEYRYQIPSSFAPRRPTYGSMPGSEAIFESGGPDYGSQAQGNAVATRPAFGSEPWPENFLSNGMPNYESQVQSGLAGEESAPNPERRQYDVFEGGTGPSMQNGPTGSRLGREKISDAAAAWGVPEYGNRAQHQFSSTGQVPGPDAWVPAHRYHSTGIALGSDVWLSNPTGIKRNNLRLSGQMVGPKRRLQAPPTTPQQQTFGDVEIAPIAKASGEKWKKKVIIENCPVIVPNGKGFVELRCDVCHCNSSAVTGKFWLGARGIQSHLRKIHKETIGPAEILARCSVRSVSAEEVKRIESGELEIEKLGYKTAKGDVQEEGAVGRAQRVGGGEGEEQEKEADARPKRTRKAKVRDISKGKCMKRTTW
jgi:hypothetical protein